MIHIGKKIKEARLTKGISQTELARRMGRTQTQVSGLEARESLQVSVLEQVAQALGVHPANFLYDIGRQEYGEEEIPLVDEKGNPIIPGLMELLESEEGKALKITDKELKALKAIGSHFPMLFKENFVRILLAIRFGQGKNMFGAPEKH